MTSDGERFIWVQKRAVVQLDLMRGPGESYSDVIIRLCKIEAAKRGSGGRRQHDPIHHP